MRAVWLTEFGGPEVLVPGDAPAPVAGPGQVVVDVEHVNITFVETQIRSGAFGPFKGGLPAIPGNGVGGVVSAVGEAVDAGLLGRRVVTSTGGSGAYAEQVAVDAAGVFDVPDGLGLDSAVALLADGRTAVWLMSSAQVSPGERVLVEAAAGGVGTLLVQLATAARARVIAAAGGVRKIDLLRELGAEVVIDYADPDWAARVRTYVGGVDVVFDGVGGDLGRTAFGLLERGGQMLSFGMASGSWTEVSAELADARGVRQVNPAMDPLRVREFTLTALAEAAAGRLRPVIGQRFALERAADAHAAVQGRQAVGKTLLDVG